jgi:hypothetical protein
MRVYHCQTENTTSATIQRVRSIEGCEATTLLTGRLAALTLMNIGILGGLSIDNYSLCW